LTVDLAAQLYAFKGQAENLRNLFFAKHRTSQPPTLQHTPTTN